MAAVTGVKSDRSLRATIRAVLKTNPELLAFWQKQAAENPSDTHVAKLVKYATEK